DRTAALFRERGSDAWFRPEEFARLADGLPCPHCGERRLERRDEIVDVWFESGVSYAALTAARAEYPWPSDLYLEGSDQHRGWFHSALLTAVNDRGGAPYKAVLTHGFTLDGAGRKMSKSLGNVIGPQEVIKEHGADVLRLWVATIDFLEDMRLSTEILTRNAEAYRKIRNTCRYILGNLFDFDAAKDAVPLADLEPIDRWALFQFDAARERAARAYEDYQFHVATQVIHRFCTVTLSSLYLDILKDRLYTAAPAGRPRRSAQTTIRILADGIARLVAPVLCFTAEEVWQALNGAPEDQPLGASVHAATFPEPLALTRDEALVARWDRLFEVREEVLKAIEIERAAGRIGQSLEAEVVLEAPDDLKRFLDAEAAHLPMVFIVSRATLGPAGEAAFASERFPGLRIGIRRAPGTKCERCWNLSTEVGAAADLPTLCERCVPTVRALLVTRGAGG
ncbi:MAG TPA: class I tRNA ligase family protein, partial [Candidatus Polarisedimenticolia bacterium]|nr:class I tRNA ligase family protein [Candidatus Polarisedimenticolia bacterium]